MPTSFELQAAQKIRSVMAIKALRAVDTRLGLKLLPLQKRDEVDLVYERHRLMRGLQGARGLGGPTTAAKLPGHDAFRVSPGYYGDHFLITERDLVERREVGSWEEFDTSGNLTAQATTFLDQRKYDRIEKNTFDLLTTGSYTVNDGNGVEFMRDVYAISTATPSVYLISDLANSAPLAFLRDTINTAETGTSVDYRSGSIVVNRATVNKILGNQNPADLGGKKLNYGQGVNALNLLNELLLANDLPVFEVYNEGYYPEPEGAAFAKFIADGKGVMIGKRTDGEQIGEYSLTRAAQNTNSGPGEWVSVQDHRDRGSKASVLIEAGHNGGPKLFYPEGVTALTFY